jgi:phenolic acid decarboxylase
VIDGTLIKQTVKTGKSIGDQIYVTEWVNPTDTIVADATSVEGKETGDSISVVQWFQANESDQWLDALGDGHDHAH